MTQVSESSIFKALNEMRSIEAPAQAKKKPQNRQQLRGQISRKHESMDIVDEPGMDGVDAEFGLDESLECAETENSGKKLYDLSETDLEILTDDEADEADEAAETDAPKKDKLTDAPSVEAVEESIEEEAIGDGEQLLEEKDECDAKKDSRDNIIKELQERVALLEEAAQEAVAVAEPENPDSLKLLERVLRKRNAPSSVCKAFKNAQYEHCLKWLKENHKLKIDLKEGFTARERFHIKKALYEHKAPDSVKDAFENGQYSVVSSFFRTRGPKSKVVRKSK